MAVLKKLFSSTRFVTGLVAILAVVLIQFLNMPEETADNIANAMITIAGLFIGGKSVSDLGMALKGKKTE